MKKILLKMKNSKIDWIITFVPIIAIVVLCLLFTILPNKSNVILGKIRFFLEIH